MAVKYNAQLPQSLPASVNVYQLQTPNVTNAEILKRSKGFGLTGRGKDFISGADSLAYREGRFHLEVHVKSGAIHYRHLDKYGRVPDKKFDLPDRRVATVARKFLETANLFPIASAKQRAITYMRSGDADISGKEIREQIIDAGVVYGRVVDDLPVDGPGGFALVSVDPDAEVIGMRSIWRGLGKRQGKVKIKSPDDFIKQFERQAATFKGDTTVTKAGFSYFEHGPHDQQTVLEPAFWVVYTVHYNDVAHKSAFVLHAGDKTFAQLIGKKRFPVTDQKRRK
jgi:hypothetical protein